MYLGLGFKSSCICWFGVRACVCVCACVFVVLLLRGYRGGILWFRIYGFLESLLCWGFTVYLGLQGSGVRVWFFSFIWP